ncbi:short chain dehydrogenase reductase family protein, partial [Nannochloropsis gaditana CCMP526]
EMGAKVILACRSKDRAEEAIRAILWESGSKIKPSQLEFWPLDVSSLQSVGDFAAAFQEKAGHKGLDILINNAGVMLNERRLTS